MARSACLWCEATVKADAVACPDCGLQNPAGRVSNATKAVRQGRRVLLGLIVVPVMLVTAYAAHSGVLPLVSADDGAAAPATQHLASVAPVPAPSFTDPLQQAVWTDGIRAVRQALAQPGYGGFQNSFVAVSTGNIVSLCGAVAGTSGYAGPNGEQRFISVFGQATATTVEGSDMSFGVLWNRVCSQGTSPA
jgi:hypothetical protein